MLEKRLYFPGEDNLGNVFVEALRFGQGLEKTASIKTSELEPELRNRIDSLKPEEGKIYVLVNALGAGEYWSCFPAGSMVKTAEGSKPIEKIIPGELVLTHENRYRKVLNTQSYQRQELVDLVVSGIPKLEPALSATPNHEIRVITRDTMIRERSKYYYRRAETGASRAEGKQAMLEALTFDWVPIGELRAGDYLAQPFPLEEDSPLQEQWGDDDFAFLFGLYTAEGCLSEDYSYKRERLTDPLKGIYFVTSNKELATLERLRSISQKYSHALDVDEDPDTHSFRLGFTWAPLARALRDHIGRGATTKGLSDWILRMPRSWQKTFFAAYCSGDGHVSKCQKDAGTIIITTASKKLAMDLRLLGARLGWVVSSNGRHNTKATWYNGNPIYSVVISGGQLRDSQERGGPEGYIHPAGYLLSPIREVKFRDWEGTVYNLEVEEDNSYTANGIAVHNSNINADWFSDKVLQDPSDSNGYKTFYRAGVFTHHRNQDHSKSAGRVIVSVYNPRMHRVELLLEIDRKKAQLEDAQWVLDKLDAGEHPPVSMGMRTPYDVCSICNHQSKTQNDRCSHILTEKNKIYPDGRKVYMINPIFKAFDISFVLIGADMTSFAIAKVASVQEGYTMQKEAFGKEDIVGGLAGAGIGALANLAASKKGERLKALRYGAITGGIAGAAMGPAHKYLHSKLAPKLASAEAEELEKEARRVPTQLLWNEDLLQAATGATVGGLAGALFSDPRHRVKGALQGAAAGGATGLAAGPVSRFYAKHLSKLSYAKSAIAQKLAARKLAELEKNIPAMSSLQASEPSIPTPVLNQMGRMPISQALATPTALGMVLKPQEFQRIILVQLGKAPMADALDRNGECFCPCHDGEDASLKFGPDNIHSGLLSRLMPLIAGRSSFGPALSTRISLQKQASAPSFSYREDPLLDQISQAYDGYRSQVVKKIERFVEKIASSHRDVLVTMFPDELEEALTGVRHVKMAGMSTPEKLTLFGVLPAMYMLTRAFEKAKDPENREGVVDFVKKHPVIAGSFLYGLLRTAAA